MSKIIGEAGKPNGHVPGHTFIDAEVVRRRSGFAFRVARGSSQGHGDEVHYEQTYAAATLDEARDRALAAEDGRELRRYIESAYAQAVEAEAKRERRKEEKTTIIVRTSLDEKARIEELAAEASLSVSDYVRKRCL